MDKIQLLHGDCMGLMANTPDKFYDLAIVDPPYGIGESSKQMHTRHHSQRKYAVKEWDNCSPDLIYFEELQRVSKNQVIWGANHFISKIAKDSPCWLFWDKDNFGDFADGELAWTSFKSAARKFKYTWNGFRKQDFEERFHPTQKPTMLYKWILESYATPDMHILDTHLGSGSSAIAAHYYGCKFTGIEIDKDYYDAAVKRFNLVTSQQQLF